MTSTRICLWSSPRNISTAMMYSFAQRPDTVVFDEPLYAHYLRVTGIEHPANAEILASQDNYADNVIRDLIMAGHGKPVAFFKQMTHHLVDVNEDFLFDVSNIIFIRDPKQILRSYSEVRAEVTMQDVGIEKQLYLFNKLTQGGHPPVVLDSNEILKNPPKVMAELCGALGIPFYEEMLHWPAGPRPEDGVWAPHWYANVHKTTGFKKQVSSDKPLPDYLWPLYEESKQYFNQLYTHSIKA
ncbi:MAG TPA: hypothetical protein VG738_10310 [Chitinophagaceae bacterium]|nr:hypothetical protein [Chitinophagaceae bacterium]